MIPYAKKWGAFNLLLRLYGAPWPRAFILSLPSTALALVLYFCAPAATKEVFTNPAVYSAFAGLVTFGLIFRTNLSYSRYWEGCSAVRLMTSKWCDAAISVISSDERAQDAKAAGGIQFRSQFTHAMSLMHGVALQSLRGDNDLTNLISGSFLETPLPPPPVDAADLAFWMTLRRKRGVFMLSSDERHFEDYWKASPLSVLGGLSASESNTLEEAQHRVFLVMCWIHRMMEGRRKQGGMKTDPPIIGRIYAVLSDGFVAYDTAVKIIATPFPFPFAQSISILLHVNAILTPFMVAKHAGAAWLVGVLTFFTVFAFYLINDVAQEIEEPFRYDPNDLPILRYQWRFNDCLVTAFAKSVLPQDLSSFFNQIAEEDSLKDALAKVGGSSKASKGSLIEISEIGEGQTSREPKPQASDDAGPMARSLNDDDDDEE